MMCSASSRAKRTSLAKQTSRTKCTSRSAQAEHIVPKTKALLTKCFCFWRRHPDLNRGIKVLQTSALPLGYGAIQLLIGRKSTLQLFITKSKSSSSLKNIGHECFVPMSFWSGLRGSNPPPSPWQGDALPNELNPHSGASGRNRTNDTGIFSPLLYQLSYRGIQQGLYLNGDPDGTRTHDL